MRPEGSAAAACAKCETGRETMKNFLAKVRAPQKGASLTGQMVATAGIMLFGFVLGVVQKWLDGPQSQLLPSLVYQLDIGNFFGRFAIWIFLGTCISVYAKSPLRAAVNTLAFFLSMLAGYYLYCHLILGFLPRAYMMI